MQQSNKKKFSTASDLLIAPYRWFGIIYHDRTGKITKKLQLYCIFLALLQTFLIFFGSYHHIVSYKFYNLDKVSRVPFIAEWISYSLHFYVCTVVFLRKNDFIMNMFLRCERIRQRLQQSNDKLVKGSIRIRVISLVILVMCVISATFFAATDSSGLHIKIILTLVYLLNFPIYLKEELLFIYVRYLRILIETINEKLRTSRILTAKDIKELRSIHNELSLLTETVSEEFEPVVTTMVAATGMQSWSDCFMLIRILTSESADIYRMISYIHNLLYQFVKLVIVCQTCENIQEQVGNRLALVKCWLNLNYFQELKLKIRLHDLGNDMKVPEEMSDQVALELVHNFS